MAILGKILLDRVRTADGTRVPTIEMEVSEHSRKVIFAALAIDAHNALCRCRRRGGCAVMANLIGRFTDAIDAE